MTHPHVCMQAAICQSVAEAMNETPMVKIALSVNLHDDAKCREGAKEYREAVPKYLANFTKVLGDKMFFHGALWPLIMTHGSVL